MSSSSPPPPEQSSEISELAERVSALRQELEIVEARLRGLGSGVPFETVDVPTVLTTNHAVRQTRRQSILLVTSAAGVLAIGILLGVLLGRPSTVATAPAPTPTMTEQVTPPVPTSREIPDPEPTPEPVASAAPPATVEKNALAPSAVTATASAEPKKTGYVTITTTPAVRVSEGNRVLGTTPLVKYELSPGDHTLLLEGADGAKKTVHVTVAAGETQSFRYTMGERPDRGF